MFTNAGFENNDVPRLTGKTYRDENFPVGSYFLSRTVRLVIKAFYHFARSADDIADNPDLKSDVKLVLLNEMDRALLGLPSSLEEIKPAWHLHRVLQNNGFTVDQPRALLVAFQRDVLNRENRNWSDLLDYCRLSADPVGRFLLEVHHESAPAALAASDALCTTLQILNHLQDCRKDFVALSRVYFPTDLLMLEGLDRTVFGRHEAPPGLRRVFENMLDRVEDLHIVARLLPTVITCRSFRIEAAVVVNLAIRLTQRLRQRDLLARFYGLRWSDWIRATVTGVTIGSWRRMMRE